MRAAAAFALTLVSLAAASVCEAAIAPQKIFTYRCEDGTELSATFVHFIRMQVAKLVIDGKTIVLPQRRSADGGRYARGGVEFWIKGRSARLTRGKQTTECQTS